MTLVVVALGSYGDVLPLLGLALALERRGHTVTFVTNGHFGDLVRRTGLDFQALGTAADYATLVHHPDLWHPRRGWRLIGTALVSDALPQAYSALCALIRSEHAAVIGSSLAFAARLVQETHRIRGVTVHLSPGVFHSAYEAPAIPGLSMPAWLPVAVKRGMWTVLDRVAVDPVVKPALNRFRRELGLPPVSRVFHEWLHAPDLVVAMFPAWFGAPQPDWPPHTRVTTFPLYDDVDGAALPPALEAYLDEGAPPLVFTPGSGMSQDAQFFAEAVSACRRLGRRGLFLTQYPAQLPPALPAGIRHFPYVPLSRLLPRCAALIHHGGIGTCAQALRAGIPHLVRPLSFDQFDNAARLVRLGVGVRVPRRAFRAPRVARRLEDLLGSSAVAAGCRAIARRFTDGDPLRETCEVIESAINRPP